jgi:L-2-hydroxyglutarate oxidase LhgO
MYKRLVKCDLLIIGSGVVGLSIGIAYLRANPGKKVIIADKEELTGKHASGRNSGVLHAGFYYSPESLKAKFCRTGNLQLRSLAKEYGIPIHEVGKVVVARNVDEDERLETLFSRGLQNGVELELLDEKFLQNYEPLAKTTNRFLWSPTTAIADPKLIIRALENEFKKIGGRIDFGTKVELKVRVELVYDANEKYDADLIVNAAGAQADRISRQINVGLEYAMLPFMGVYRVTKQEHLPLQRLVYPVPHPVNPFLGVHFTLTTDGFVKIGPTAIPIFGREQYSFREGWSLADTLQTLKGSAALISGESHNFGSILKSEWPKIMLKNLVKESTELVEQASEVKHWKKKPPGIRAQLVHIPSGKLEQDFVVKRYLNSVHVLNAVSPGWTSAIPFGSWIVEEYLSNS